MVLERKKLLFETGVKWRSKATKISLQYFIPSLIFVANFGLAITFTNPSTRAGYDTRSIFKQSLTGLNSKFSFS